MPRIPFRLAPLAIATTILFSAAAQAANDKPASQDVQDARREAQIWTTYGFNPSLRALDISVDANGNTVVLTGTVENEVEKDLAEQIALSVEGVKKVDNRLKVDAAYSPPKRTRDRDFSTTVEDLTITAKVKSKLLWNDHTDGHEINVDTRGGTVTLKGAVESAAVKDLAGRLAENTQGVVVVRNELIIGESKGAAKGKDAKDGKDADFAVAEVKKGAAEGKADVSDAWISTKVKSTLLFSRNVDGSDINVDTSKGVVKLSGRVDSAAERELAVELARDIRGVKKVDASALKGG